MRKYNALLSYVLKNQTKSHPCSDINTMYVLKQRLKEIKMVTVGSIR